MDEKNITLGVTAFIDILGFGNKVVKADSFDEIRKIHEEIKLIQDAFDFDTKDALIKQGQEMHKSTILAFSDCVIVNIPLVSQATEVQGTFEPIMSEIAGFAYGQGTCCLNSLFIRGGLDLGWWYRDNNTLISQSLVNAYQSENGVSFPVISLTDEAYKYFSGHSHRNYYSNDIDPISKLFRSVKVKEKNYYYIDYISICLEAQSWQTSSKKLEEYRRSSPDDRQRIMNEGFQHNVDNWLYKHSANIKKAHADTDDPKVKMKYEWLAEYHNEIASNFSVNTSCQCVLPK